MGAGEKSLPDPANIPAAVAEDLTWYEQHPFDRTAADLIEIPKTTIGLGGVDAQLLHPIDE